MNPLQRLEELKETYTNIELKIYNYIINDPNVVARFTIDLLAKKSNTSKSAIIRLCKKIGYQGFSEFKFELSRYMVSMKAKKENDKSPIDAIISYYGEHIQNISNHISSSQLQKVAKIIINSNRIKIFGYNRSGLSATQLRLRLAKIGIDCEAICDPILMLNQEDILKENDTCIIFTIGGSSTNYKEHCARFMKKGVNIIVVTMNQLCILNKYTNDIFYLPCISKATQDTFLDDQIIFFVFIEILLSYIAAE